MGGLNYFISRLETSAYKETSLVVDLFLYPKKRYSGLPDKLRRVLLMPMFKFVPLILMTKL
jgi:hypothetical protein